MNDNFKNRDDFLILEASKLLKGNYKKPSNLYPYLLLLTIVAVSAIIVFNFGRNKNVAGNSNGNGNSYIIINSSGEVELPSKE